MKHTPGPWKYDATGCHCQGRVIRHNGVVVCRLDDYHIDPTAEEGNARLIAAAPELYQALRLARGAFLAAEESYSYELNQIALALQKADGEEG